MNLTLTKQGKRILVELRAGNDLVANFVDKFTTDSKFDELAKLIQQDKMMLIKLIDEFKAATDETTKTIDLDKEERKIIAYVRSITSNVPDKQYSGGLEVFEKMLGDSSLQCTEPVICWDGTDNICAVDFDSVKSEPLDENALLVFLQSFQPLPTWAWVTHNGGIRLIYYCDDTLAANEIAAIAYLNLSGYLRAGLEIKSETRHPLYANKFGKTCSRVFRPVQNADKNVLRKWMRQYSIVDSEIADYMTERGYEAGKRYPHSHCPIAPSDDSKRDPVIVNDSGIFCYVCASAGLDPTGRQPGYFPYSMLVGDHTSSMLRRMLDNFTHWTHAKYILGTYYDVRPDILKWAYRAALKIHHGPIYSKMVNSVFSTGVELIRVGSSWTNEANECYGEEVREVIKRLPAVQYINAKGMVATDNEKAVILQQSFDLSHHGYPSLSVVHGMKLPSAAINTVPTLLVHKKDMAKEENIKLRPRYTDKRTNGWQIIETIFPGINRNYLKLLIASKFITDLGNSMHPFMFVRGQSGVAKSTTPVIAASILGDHCTEILYSKDNDRLREGFRVAGSSGSFGVLNEIIKEMNTARVDISSSMSFLLNLTPESISWKLYKGNVPLGYTPVIVMTDTELPEDIANNIQIGRRTALVDMTKKVDWEKTINEYRIGHPSKFRLFSQETANASNEILSEVIDEFFTGDVPTFRSIVATLGFNMMNETEVRAETDDILKDFYKAWVEAPALTLDEANRWRGKGWKLLHRNGQSSEFLNLWLALVDGDKFNSSRKCSEYSWSSVTGKDTRFEVKGTHLTVGVRFL